MDLKKNCLFCQCFNMKKIKCNLHDLNLQTIKSANSVSCIDFLFFYETKPVFLVSEKIDLGKKCERIFMLKLYLKRILTISSILTEYSQISDSQIVDKLRHSILLYLNELHNTKNMKWIKL